MDQGIQCRARESGLVNYRSGHLVGTDCFRIARQNEAARVASLLGAYRIEAYGTFCSTPRLLPDWARRHLNRRVTSSQVSPWACASIGSSRGVLGLLISLSRLASWHAAVGAQRGAWGLGL